MANMLTSAIAAALAMGCVKADAFVGEVPNTLEKFTLEVGDILEIPSELVPLRDIEGIAGTYTFVEVLSPRTGRQVFRLRPSLFFRKAVDQNGLEYLPSGNVFDTLRAFRTNQEVMDFLKGKSIRVSRVRMVSVPDPNGNTRPKRVYDFEWVTEYALEA